MLKPNFSKKKYKGLKKSIKLLAKKQKKSKGMVLSKPIDHFPRRPPVTAIIFPTNDCYKNNRQLYRKFYLINEEKFKYCDNILYAVKYINMQQFGAFVPSIAESLTKMASIKRTLYCNLCD